MATPRCEDCFRDAKALYFNTPSSPGTWYCDLHVPPASPAPPTAAERAALDLFERFANGQRADSLFWSDREREQYGPGLEALFTVLEMARRAGAAAAPNILSFHDCGFDKGYEAGLAAATPREGNWHGYALALERAVGQRHAVTGASEMQEELDGPFTPVVNCSCGERRCPIAAVLVDATRPTTPRDHADGGG